MTETRCNRVVFVHLLVHAVGNLRSHPVLAAVLSLRIRRAVSRGITVAFVRVGGRATCHCRSEQYEKYRLEKHSHRHPPDIVGSFQFL